MTDTPSTGQVWKHTKRGDHYLIIGSTFNSITDAEDVLYQPMYACEHSLFTRQRAGADKAWETPNEDGTPRFVKVADDINQINFTDPDDATFDSPGSN